MKTQIAKPARSKASYTDEYKQQALELWRASGRSAAKVATWRRSTFPGGTADSMAGVNTARYRMTTDGVCLTFRAM